jgi:hypothetical protein
MGLGIFVYAAPLFLLVGFVIGTLLQQSRRSGLIASIVISTVGFLSPYWGPKYVGGRWFFDNIYGAIFLLSGGPCIAIGVTIAGLIHVMRSGNQQRARDSDANAQAIKESADEKRNGSDEVNRP